MALLQHQMGHLAYSINSETAIQLCFLKYNRALKSHHSVKLHINYRLLFLIKMELLSIDRLNLGLLTFCKICEFLKSAKVKIGSDVFSLFPA